MAYARFSDDCDVYIYARGSGDDSVDENPVVVCQTCDLHSGLS